MSASAPASAAAPRQAPEVVTSARGMAIGQRLRELAAYRDLVWNLTVRDLKLKYKGSVLGVAWSLLNPLLMMLIYTAVFSVLLKVVTVPNYWALVLGGILAWNFFSTSLNGATSLYVRNPNLISKVYFPIEALPLSLTLSNFVNFLVPLVLLLTIEVALGFHLGASLLLLPLLLAALLALAAGMAVLLAALTVFFRDIEHFAAIALAAWFYLTPVFYPLDPHLLPRAAVKYLGLAWLNPLAWYLESFHAVLFFGRWPAPLPLAGALLTGPLLLALGYLAFHRLRARIPEEI